MPKTDNKMIPVTLMIDKERHQKLKTASRSTRISMSELFRLAVDNLMVILVNPEKPDWIGLQKLLSSDPEEANETSSADDTKVEKKRRR